MPPTSDGEGRGHATMRRHGRWPTCARRPPVARSAITPGMPRNSWGPEALPRSRAAAADRPRIAGRCRSRRAPSDRETLEAHARTSRTAGGERSIPGCVRRRARCDDRCKPIARSDTGQAAQERAAAGASTLEDVIECEALSFSRRLRGPHSGGRHLAPRDAQGFNAARTCSSEAIRASGFRPWPRSQWAPPGRNREQSPAASGAPAAAADDPPTSCTASRSIRRGR